MILAPTVHSGSLFSNASNASITTISLIAYGDIHIQMNPIIGKIQSTCKLYAVKAHTLDLKCLIKHVNCIWYSKLLFKQLRSSFLRHTEQPSICAGGKAYPFSLLCFSLKNRLMIKLTFLTARLIGTSFMLLPIYQT